MFTGVILPLLVSEDQRLTAETVKTDDRIHLSAPLLHHISPRLFNLHQLVQKK